MIASLKRKRAEQRYRRGPHSITDLNAPLLYLSPHDTFTIGDACEGVHVFGATGAGKTSGPGRALALSLLRSGMGGLVLCAKADEPQLWMHYAELTGRLDDLVMIAPVSDGGRFTFNILDHEMHRGTAGGGNAANVVETLSVLAEIADAGSGAVGGKGGIGGGENGGFWESSRRTMTRHAVTILAASEGRIRLPDIRRLILTAPQDRAEAAESHWQSESFCFAAIERASSAPLTDDQRIDLEMAVEYFLIEFPALADKTRSIVVSSFTGMCDDLVRAPLRDLLCGTTTITPEATFEGKILVVAMPVKQHGRVGRLVAGAWKHAFQQAAERRPPNTQSSPVRPAFLFADEYQHFITSTDREFQSTARSSRICTIAMSQNLPAYYAQIGGSDPRSVVDGLLGNLRTQILCANGDQTTNRWSEETIARGWTTSVSTSSSDHRGSGAGGAGGFGG
ncbi:MAG: hypothetical protein KDA16_00255, partial [Phycisphaerales bacterium]|nr:hypothetical protein [Phycisphaerales bacterium]